MRKIYLMVMVFVFFQSIICFAGVFDLPSFLEPQKWSAGIEPEVVISDGAGAGINIKPRYGINDFLNAEGFFGFGSGARGFRVGAIADFEWFPNTDAQPGVATPFSMTYSVVRDNGDFSFGPMPMIYKSIKTNGISVIPFAALPAGWRFYDGQIRWFTQVALGAMFKIPSSPQLRFSAEAGFNVGESYSYLSGGVTYYH